MVAFWLGASGLAVGVRGASFWWNSGFVNGGAIPDNSATGWQDVRSVSMPGATSITDVDVLIDIGGATIFDGWNGDIYAKLSHSSGFSILFNRVGRTTSRPNGYGQTGFGASTSGIRFRLDDAAGTDVHYYQTVSHSINGLGQVTGTWQPDGRDVDPTVVNEDSARSASVFLAAFNGLDPNGEWTLFVSDRGFANSHKVNGWGLEIAAVPEPGVGAFVLGCGLLGFAWARHRSWRRLPLP